MNGMAPGHCPCVLRWPVQCTSWPQVTWSQTVVPRFLSRHSRARPQAHFDAHLSTAFSTPGAAAADIDTVPPRVDRELSCDATRHDWPRSTSDRVTVVPPSRPMLLSLVLVGVCRSCRKNCLVVKDAMKASPDVGRERHKVRERVPW